ncbi:MAG: hypothetical protein DRI71_10530 [Bacteroidetes bacterium]|nr:MAG: hypothetical protein DRI71_10530 [Bacteroidota bacterium]
MKKNILSISVLFLSLNLMGQNTSSNSSGHPYYQIPDYPAEYTAETVAARMVDGLGFRYYWATEGLRTDDLAYKPNDEARTSEETIDHILGLTNVILNSVLKEPNVRSGEQLKLTFDEKRKKTLENLKQTSDILKASKPGALKDYKIVFQNDERSTEYPFWNQINGPISDALWHVGQVVSLRRSSGNPFNSKVSVLSGKLRE